MPERGATAGRGAYVLSQTADEAMRERTAADYPEETCGLVFSGSGGTQVVKPMENIQNRLHRDDPEHNPRDARTAYQFDAKALEETLRSMASSGSELSSIYHSHPDHDAYFSATDSAAAAVFGEPNYPGVTYLVYSVRRPRALPFALGLVALGLVALAFQAHPAWALGLLIGLPILDKLGRRVLPGDVKDLKAFDWSTEESAFVEVPIEPTG